MGPIKQVLRVNPNDGVVLNRKPAPRAIRSVPLGFRNPYDSPDEDMCEDIIDAFVEDHDAYLEQCHNTVCSESLPGVGFNVQEYLSR